MVGAATSEKKQRDGTQRAAKRAEPRRPGSAAPTGNQELARKLGVGSPLPIATQRDIKRSFGRPSGDVRVHEGPAASATAERQNANAFTIGNHIVFGSGKYAPGTQSGDALLFHEIAHAFQQQEGSRGGASAQTVEREAREASSQARAGKPVGRLSPAAPRVMRDPKTDSKEPKVLVDGIWFLVKMQKFPSAADMKRLLRDNEDADPDVIDECQVSEIKGAGDEVTYRFVHPVLGRIADLTASASDATAWSERFYWLPPTSQGSAVGRQPGGGAGRVQKKVVTNKDNRKKPPEQTLQTQATGNAPTPDEPMRLYEQVKDKLPSAPDADGGEDAVRFARFLQLNKDKIEGIIPPGKKGKGITQEQVQKVIDLYGKFIVATPLDAPGKLETQDDFNKVFNYDPNWQKMSKQDRQMLIDISKMSPDDLKQGKLETSKLTQEMKEQIALRLSDSWPSEVLEAAKAAFSDPGFLISLVLTIAIYIGLWLTPDPTFITKLAAGTLTVVMWAQFAWNDIWETMVEYDAFGDNVKQARTAAELKAAGDRLGRKIGAVGFDILMMIATWGLGKAAGPKLRAAGAKRGVARAEGARSIAAADPAAGLPKAAEGPATKLLGDAKANAKGSTPTAVLDALEPKLDAAGQKGLRTMRNSGGGDTGTYKALEGQAGRGNDLNHFLGEKAATPEAKAQAKAKLLQAEAKVARAKLIQADTIADPKLRKEARAAQMRDLVQRFKARLQDAGLLDTPEVKKAAQNHNVQDLRAALGEAIAREQLGAEPSNPAGSRVVSNLAIVKEVPGYETIEGWKQATNASPGDVAKMFQGKGKIYQSLGEIDSMVVEDIPSGKPKVKTIEEVKTGATDSPVKAKAQITDKVFPALKTLLAGDPSIKIFELIGKKGLGAEQTGTYDFSGKIEAQTRGPAGKGFDKSLGFDPAVLEETAQSLIDDGLPTAKPQTIPPVTGLKDEKDR